MGGGVGGVGGGGGGIGGGWGGGGPNVVWAAPGLLSKSGGVFYCW